MRGGAWCPGGVAALSLLVHGIVPCYPAPVHGMVRGGCPGETDGRRHPAPVSPPCDLVGAGCQCRRPLPRLPSRPDPHSGTGVGPHVPLYGPLFSSGLRGRAVFCMSLRSSMQPFECLQLIIFTNHCTPIWKEEPGRKIEGGALSDGGVCKCFSCN